MQSAATIQEGHMSIQGEIMDSSMKEGRVDPTEDLGQDAQNKAKDLHKIILQAQLSCDNDQTRLIETEVCDICSGMTEKETGISLEVLTMTEDELLEKSEVELIGIARSLPGDDPILNAYTEHFEKKQANISVKGTISKKDYVFFIASAIKYFSNDTIEASAQQNARDNISHMAPEGFFDAQQEWLPIAPMPRDLCRVTPFFPMARTEKSKRPFIENLVIAKSSWGEILYTGPKLSTEEEDVLMAIVAIINDEGKRKLSTHQGRKTYSYSGSLLPIVKMTGRDKAGSSNYKQFLSSMKLLMSGVVELRLNRDKKRSQEIIDLTNLLTHARWDVKNKRLEVTLNPYFYECYLSGSITPIDVLERASLQSPTAKLLHKFINSHRDGAWEGHFLTLANVLNINRNQEDKYIRRQIKDAVRNMIDKEILSRRSGFTSKTKDAVFLELMPKKPALRTIEKKKP